MTDAIDQARALLPWWAPWGNVLFALPAVILLLLIAAWAGTALALRPVRRYPGNSWVEKARLAWPARVVAGRDTLLLMLAGGMLMLLHAGPLARVPPRIVVAGGALGGLLAGLWMAQRVRRCLGIGHPSFLRRLRSTATFLLIAYPQVLVLVVLWLVVPIAWNLQTWLTLLAGGLAMFGLVLGGSLWLARRLGTLRPAGERLDRLVALTAERVGLHPRAAYQADLGFANAFALPAVHSLVVTDKLLDHMSDEELIAILAHELAHLNEPRPVLLARLGYLLLFVPLGAAGPIVVTFGLPWLVAVALVLFLALQVLLRLARRMEEAADRAGRAHEVAPGDYARALERLHELELIPLVMPGKQLTHPHLYDRLVAAGATPDYPRPAPPSRWRDAAALALTVAVLIAGMVALQIGMLLLQRRTGEPAILCRIALKGGDARAVSDLALLRYLHDNGEQAVTLYRAASELEPESAHYAGNLAIVLANLDRCEEAQAAQREALRRYRNHPDSQAASMVFLAQEAVQRCQEKRRLDN